MKPKYLLLFTVWIFACFKMNYAQSMDYWDWFWQRYRTPYEDRFQEWWEGVWAQYMAAKRAWEMGFLQDWNENMQEGIKRLNTIPQQVGVTPINGALLLNETDISVPGRLGNNISVTRYYNSKIWYADTSDGVRHDSLSLTYHLGTGWELHYGRVWPSSGAKIFEKSNGTRIYFKASTTGGYVSTDGSFMRLFSGGNVDTIKTGEGTQLIFGQYGDIHERHILYLTKIIDANGNVTQLSYKSYNNTLLDTIRTSTNECLTFHYHQGWPDDPLYMLDSIRYVGFNGETLSVIYHYDTVSTDSSPFGILDHVDSTFLLESAIYPNGDSVYYDYNKYYELTGVHTTNGGRIQYEYQTDTFYIPHAEVFPPEDSAYALMQLTRGVTKIKIDDPWSAPDSIRHVRMRSYMSGLRALSNGDSVWVYDYDNNYELLTFMASRAPLSEADKNQWKWDNGELIQREFFDKQNNLLRKERSSRQLTTSDSIPVLLRTRIDNDAKTYETKYYEYDDLGNTRLIHVKGDTSISSDDYWIHRKYAISDNDYCSFWLSESAQGYTSYDGISVTKFFSQAGVDTLTITRRWFPSDSSATTTKVYATPAFGDSIEESLKTDFQDTLATVVVYAREYTTSEVCTCSVAVYIGPDIPPGGQRTDTDFDSKNSYAYINLYHLMTEEFVNSDSSSSSWLRKTSYFYDDTSHVVRNYTSPSPVQWETPMVPNMRGNLTRIEHWKDQGDRTKTEFRFDNVGNVVMSITHPETNTAETTFTYYDPPSDPDEYNYAFPWRVVNHLSTSVGSLYTQTEYDVHTGLVTKTYDFNQDSTRYEYDNVNRLIKVFYPRETSASKRTKYYSYQGSTQLAAVLDSLKLDNTQWIVSKRFFDGFGRLIQTKNFDYDNNRTIVQSLSYNGTGLKDSVSNPYEISGTTNTDYSAPGWGSLNITRYEYDGLNRTAKITHPDNEYVTVKYYTNTDTIIDEKGNKTIHVYNAFGALDIVYGAYNTATRYTYDRLGRLTNVRDAANKDTKYYYDKLSRLAAMNCPDARSPYKYPDPDGDSVDVLYEYDDVGNLTRKKDANGWVDYSYDDINRLIEIRHSTNSGSTWPDTVQFVYDIAYSPPPPYPIYNNPKGQLGKMVTKGVDSICYYYNDRGSLTLKHVYIDSLWGTKTVKYLRNKAELCTTLHAYYNIAKYSYDRMGRVEGIRDIVNSFEYNPAGQIVKINHQHDVIDTLAYNDRLMPTYIKSYESGPVGDDYLKLAYTYEDNGNVASIVDSLVSGNSQAFAYDSLNRLLKVELAADTQTFTYDSVGNRKSKDGQNYSYYQGTNRISEDHRNYTYDYDDNGNIIRRRSNSTTVDSFAYDWNNRLIYYKNGDETVDFAYNASGLRVKKHYHSETQGGFASGFHDATNDMGLVSQDIDSIYNKERDINTIYAKDTSGYYYFTIVNRHLFSNSGKLKLFITLDIDTIENSGRITYPEDTMTTVPKQAAWEYCIYVDGDDYGFYNTSGTKNAKPFPMSVNKITGDTGKVKIQISKSLINNPTAVRYTIATFSPTLSNTDTLWQGGSSACDVFPGTRATFGGETNGYGEMTALGGGVVTDYTIFYVYDGINPIVEYAPKGSILQHYIYVGSHHIARVSGADTHWYHCDALGSPRKMNNELGGVVWSATYYPFGEMTAGSGNTHGFTGKEFDSEMGLNYFCQRYYEPEIGRFMTLDPQGSPASSPYAYCANKPLEFIDPTGEAAVLHIGLTQYDEPSGYWPTGWGNPSLVWFASSSEMDPDFWSAGWDWGNLSFQHPLIKAAMFLLSSGIFEWDIHTQSGWHHINIGEWIKSEGIEITRTYDNTLAQIAPGGDAYTYNAWRIFLNPDKIKEKGGINAWDFAETITHEATHQFLFRSGSIPSRLCLDAGAGIVRTQENIAYWTGYMFERNMSPRYRNYWILNAWIRDVPGFYVILPKLRWPY